MSRIVEAHPTSPLAERYGKKSIKQIKTQQALAKNKKRIASRRKIMAKDLPDYMREFDTSDDWGFTPVTSKPESDKPSIDPKVVEGTNIELSKVKSDVGDIKSMMNEIMQIVAEKDTITKEISDEDTLKRFKDIEKIVLPFLYNLSKSDEPIYIGQIECRLLRHK